MFGLQEQCEFFSTFYNQMGARNFQSISLKSCIDKGTMFFGGSVYKKSENPNCSLRYKFGKKREEINSIQRNKNPYKYVSSRNFMCKKDVIVEALSKIESVSYGNDYVFGSILKRKRIDIIHFDNPVLIENIEENSIFIRKTHQALDNVIKCYLSLIHI